MKRRTALCATAIVSVMALGACNDEAASTGTATDTGEATINTVVTSGPINASSNDTLVAFNLTTNSVVPNRATGDWDIAFRRYEIRLNSPATAGAVSKGVTAYAVGNNKAKTDAEVLAFTVSNTLADFDAFRAGSIPADSLFATDKLTENRYGYLNLAGAPTAAPLNYWKIKTANGGYAVFHATAITYASASALGSVIIESRLQTGTTLGPVLTDTVSLSAGAASISLVSNRAVTPSGCNWDISVNPNTFEMVTNSACSVGTYPGGSSPTFVAVTTASDAAQYLTYITSLGGPIPNSVSDLSAPFRYNLQNTNKLHPAFNIFLVKVGAKIFKVEVINYYDPTGTSGYPTIRAARIL